VAHCGSPWSSSATLDAALEGAQVPLQGSFLQIAEDRKNVGPGRLASSSARPRP